MNQPSQQATQQATQNYPGYPQGGYPQQPQFPVQPAQPQPYRQFPYWQPYPAYPAPQAPGFTARIKDPRKSGALRTLNRMGLLMVAQTALSLILEIIVLIVCYGCGFDVLDDTMAMVMMSIGFSPVCTALPPLIYLAAGRKDWNFHLRFGRASFIGCLLVVLAGLGVCMIANFPAVMLDDLLKDMGAKKAPDVLGQGGWIEFAIEFTGVAVMVPMLEEFAFRGVILSGLRRYGTGFAVVASALIFGMAHMSASSVVFATIAGLALGTAYVLTGNLWVSVFIHMLNNGISIVESYSELFVGTGIGQQEMLSGLIMLSVCALALLAFILLLALRRRLFPKREPMVPADGVLYAPLSFGESLATMLKSVVLWSILAMVLVETAMMFLQ